MSKYTTIDDPEVDRIVEEDLNLIVASLREALEPHVQSILLSGGFGRGEGAVVRERGRYRPINDYDIVIVRKGTIPVAALERLQNAQRRLGEVVHVKQVDVSITHWFVLLIPSPTVMRYELSEGHIVLYGSLPYRIQRIPSHWIPLHEGTKYFRNRGGGLLIARLLLDGYGDFPEPMRLELAALEINKALLVLGDAYLIEHGDYHFSYRRRKKVFLERYKKYGASRELAEMYIAAVEEKLVPDFTSMSRATLDQRWTLVARTLLEEFLRFEGVRLRRRFNTFEEYRGLMAQKTMEFQGFTRRLVSLFAREDIPRIVAFRVACFLLLQSALEKQNTELLNVANILGVDASAELNWADLVRLFLIRWHPGGIVSRIVDGVQQGSS